MACSSCGAQLPADARFCPACGAARGDDELLERAQACFAALDLDWHAAQTERLLAGL